MAYVTQEMKKELSPAIKYVLMNYGYKGSIAITHNSTLVINIKSGPDIIGNYNTNTKNAKNTFCGQAMVVDHMQPNRHTVNERFSSEFKDMLTDLFAAANAKNYDNSDVQTDYFDVGYYVTVKIGDWDKPYIVK